MWSGSPPRVVSVVARGSAIDAMAADWKGNSDLGGRLEPRSRSRNGSACLSGPAGLGCRGVPRQFRTLNSWSAFGTTYSITSPRTFAADEAHLWQRPLEGKFHSNQLMVSSGNPWWRDHGLGRGCCEWAVDSVRALAEYVVNRVGIKPNYVRIEEVGWMGDPRPGDQLCVAKLGPAPRACARSITVGSGRAHALDMSMSRWIQTVSGLLMSIWP